MKQIAAVFAFAVILFNYHPAFAAFGFGDVVFDPTNWAENAAQVLQTLEVIQNQLKDLAELAVFPIVAIAQDLARLTVLMNRIKTMIGFDEGGVDQLYETLYGTIPCTNGAYVTWLGLGQSLQAKALHAAMLVQTLVNDIFELIECITRIIDQALRIIGNLQGLQTLAQIQSVLVHQEARMMAMLGVFHSAIATGEMLRLAKDRALACIYAARLADIPRVNTYGLQLGQ